MPLTICLALVFFVYRTLALKICTKKAVVENEIRLLRVADDDDDVQACKAIWIYCCESHHVKLSTGILSIYQAIPNLNNEVLDLFKFDHELHQWVGAVCFVIWTGSVIESLHHIVFNYLHDVMIFSRELQLHCDEALTWIVELFHQVVVGKNYSFQVMHTLSPHIDRVPFDVWQRTRSLSWSAWKIHKISSRLLWQIGQ